MNNRTDLALELCEIAEQSFPNGLDGITQQSRQYKGMNVTRIAVTTDDAAKQLGKPRGNYTTIETADFKNPAEDFHALTTLVAQEMEALLPPSVKSALIVGLGNAQITPDALGPKAVDYILATRHITPEVAKAAGISALFPCSAIAPGVLGQTGIETAEIISSLVQKTAPDVVIVIDALAAKELERLGRTIQLSDSGISPGSGVLNRRKEVSRATLGTAVLSIGVPMVVDMETIVRALTGKDCAPLDRAAMVTPREIDLCIEHAAKAIAFGINRALQKELSLDDLIGIVGC